MGRSGVSLPRPPEPGVPYRFPFIASIAPVVAALAMWLVTGSAFALLFAGLGPVTAIASWVDNRFGRRRTRRRESRRFAAEVVATREQISRAHASERRSLMEATPAASSIVDGQGSVPARWSVAQGSEVVVCLGRGTVTSAIRLESVPERQDLPIAEELRALADRAGMLDQAPIPADARCGIGVVGPREVAGAVARALAVQVAWLLSPAQFWWAGADEDEVWLTELPHHGGLGRTVGSHYEFGSLDAQGSTIVIAIAPQSDRLPGACRLIIDLGAKPPTIVRHPDPERRGAIQPEMVSREQCIGWARRLRADATAEGIVAPHRAVPDAVELASLLRVTDDAGRGSLACEPAVSAAGAVTLDLVADGPHAVIGGTTGSGKSELLIAWVLAMAAPRSPVDVTFLLVDFKGGSAFDALARLPHTVGIITDLDEAGARRAWQSLRAELRYRERLLVAEGVRSIDETTSCARLVIVVDEFGAMLAEHPDLHALFGDLAARGRSLGIHLVLCTQRPAGVVRDSVLANADLRVSLRVNNRADSAAVVGTDSAAAIPLGARGRAVVTRAGANEQLVQFALADLADVGLISERWASTPPPRRPWCEPLPSDLAVEALPVGSDGLVFGLCDLPQEQRLGVAVYHPQRDGHLLVVGGAGSGKTTALAAIARSAAAVVRIPGEPAAAWDTVEDLVEAIDRGDRRDRPGHTLAIADDFDSVVARFGGDHRAGFADLIGRVLRDGPARGIHVVISVQRFTSEVQSAALGVPSRLLLRQSSRQDFILAGGEGAHYVDNLPPGGAVWHGLRAQVAHQRSERVPDATARQARLEPGRPLAIVTSRAAHLLRRYPRAVALSETIGDLRAVVATASIVVGDIEEWQSRWGAVAALRGTAEILFDGCSTADFRALTRSRQLPPPLPSELCWRLNDDGTASRVRLPGIDAGD